MINVTDYPYLLFLVCLVTLWLARRIGTALSNRLRPLAGDVREDFGVIQAATMMLLGLIIGFTFSMAISRYDQRKNCEEKEANAIGTEYLRADLLPAAEAAKVRELLKTYLDQRILFHTTRDKEQLRQVLAREAKLQEELWSAVQAPAVAKPSPIIALAVAGMNEMLDSQGYTQAAWWNRIPTPAWELMAMIAIGCNLLLGYGARDPKAARVLLLVFPLVVSISFLLIADIDAPRGGIIHVEPQNLLSLAQSLGAH
jgi:hypothetical protein